MDVHVQRCQNCLATVVRNVLVRDPGQPQTVYVQCTACGELVARYVLREYYHHGKGMDSWLRSLGSAAAESGRDMLGEFARIQQAAVQGFDQVRQKLAERSGDHETAGVAPEAGD